mmetsp:Transcript_43686/g.100829  ORF Transcript_43686/g.100829 Transcript_43686/m.100829 type:complete len:111 (+) Transcript_43686:392-724(+)
MVCASIHLSVKAWSQTLCWMHRPAPQKESIGSPHRMAHDEAAAVAADAAASDSSGYCLMWLGMGHYLEQVGLSAAHVLHDPWYACPATGAESEVKIEQRMPQMGLFCLGL